VLELKRNMKFLVVSDFILREKYVG
jgi:hypothetical protein